MSESSNRHFFGLRFIAEGKDTNGQFFMSETSIPSGDMGPPFHSHAHEDESFYIKQGQLTFFVEDRTIELQAGDFLQIKKGERHSWRNESKENAELMVIFSPAGIENMFKELEENPFEIKTIGLKYGTQFDL